MDHYIADGHQLYQRLINKKRLHIAYFYKQNGRRFFYKLQSQLELQHYMQTNQIIDKIYTNILFQILGQKVKI